MFKNSLPYFLVFEFFFISICLAGDGTHKPKKADTNQPLSKTPINVEYKPPLRGAPKYRVSAGIRGNQNTQHPQLTILCPEEVGFTYQDQPTVFWFLNQSTAYPIEISIIRNTATVLNYHLPNGVNAGLQKIAIDAHDFKLKPDVDYEIIVALIIDSNQRTKDIVATGAIRLISTTDTNKTPENKVDLPAYYAQQGIWYDSLSSAINQIESDQNFDFRSAVLELIKQVGLTEVAEIANKNPALLTGNHGQIK